MAYPAQTVLHDYSMQTWHLAYLLALTLRLILEIVSFHALQAVYLKAVEALLLRRVCGPTLTALNKFAYSKCSVNSNLSG